MFDWFTIRECVIAGAAIAFVAMAVVAIFASEFRKLSRRGASIVRVGYASINSGSGLSAPPKAL